MQHPVISAGGGAAGASPKRRRSRGAPAVLERARVAIENGMADEDIAARLNDFGYDAERLRAGLALCDRLQQACADQDQQNGVQHGSTDRLHAGREEARRLYTKTLQLARLSFGDDPGAREALQLRGKRKQSLSAWIEQALTFYDNLLEREGRVRTLEKFNHGRERLIAERAMVGRVQTLNAEQEQRKGDARMATRERGQARAALDLFMRDYTAVIRMALADEPAWRKQLGIK